MKRFLLPLILIFALSTQGSSANYYEFSPKLTKAYQKTISTQFVDARALISQVKEEEPNNVLVYYVENYIDILTIYINEDYDEFQKLESKKDYRLNQLKTGDESSPYYLYTQAEIRLQWAVARLKFEEYRTAMFEVRRAFKMLEKNTTKFPDFIANKKSLGILHSAIGAIPPNYKWAVEFVGMSGTIEQGRAEIKEVVNYSKRNPDFIFKDETIIMYSFMILHIGNDSKESWNIIRSSSLNAATNPLICFAQASVAQHTGKNDEAIKILENRPKGKQYHPFHYLDYMLGLSKLYKQDPEAGFYLNKYVMNFKGRNYIKECYQRLAWFELLKGNDVGYKSNMALVLTRGKASIGGDENALKAAKNNEIPNTTLLQGRLLFDGGYLTEANKIFNSVSESSFSTEKEQLEYHYRRGRVLQKMYQFTDALEAYNITIEKGHNKSYYFACRAAVEAGIIKEEQYDYTAARVYYNKCLDMSPSEYKSGLHAKAKAGLSRIKKK